MLSEMFSALSSTYFSNRIPPSILKRLPSFKNIVRVLTLCMLLVFLAYKKNTFYAFTTFRGEWFTCADFIREGVLWAGQPFCPGSPLSFYVIFVLQELVARPYVQFLSVVFVTLLAFVGWFFFWEICKKELGLKDWFFPALLYGVLVYLNLFLESSLVTFFFLVAYYFLFCSTYTYRRYLCGVALLLTLLSKMTMIFPIFFLVLWYAKNRLFINRDEEHSYVIRLKQVESLLKEYAEMLVPIILGFFLLYLRYPFTRIYLWDVYTLQENVLTIKEAFFSLLFLNWFDVTFFLLFTLAIVSTCLFIKERKFYALVSGPLLLCTMFLLTKALGSAVLSFHYYVPFFPFTVLLVLRLQQIFGEVNYKYILYGLLFLLFLFPGLYYGPFQLYDELGYADQYNLLQYSNPWMEKTDFVKKIHYGYSIIPEQEGRILVEMERNMFVRLQHTIDFNVPPEKVDILDRSIAQSYPDWGTLEGFMLLLAEDFAYNSSDSTLNERETQIVSDFNNGTYSLLIYGPPEWKITERLLPNFENMSDYCSVYVPSSFWLVTDGRHQSIFIFKDHDQCAELASNLYFYYSLEFDEICATDKESSRFIKYVMSLNGLVLDVDCPEGGNSLAYFKSQEGIKKVETIVMICMFLLPFMYLLLSKWFNLLKR